MKSRCARWVAIRPGCVGSRCARTHWSPASTSSGRALTCWSSPPRVTASSPRSRTIPRIPVVGIACAGVGLVLLIYAIQGAWRAYRRARRRARDLSVYAGKEVIALEHLAAQLNEHGFALEHSASELFPKLGQVLAFLEQPL